MAVKPNKEGFDRAKKLIQEGHFVWDERIAWSEHQPTAAKENEFKCGALRAARGKGRRLSGEDQNALKIVAAPTPGERKRTGDLFIERIAVGFAP